jgi:hypothetical protein
MNTNIISKIFYTINQEGSLCMSIGPVILFAVDEYAYIEFGCEIRNITCISLGYDYSMTNLIKMKTKNIFNDIETSIVNVTIDADGTANEQLLFHWKECFI